MLRLFLNKYLFWSADDSELTPDYAIFSLKTNEEINAVGTMQFTIANSHPRLRELKVRRATFILADNDNILFVGRLTELAENFNFMIDVTVSDMIESLDCVLPYFLNSAANQKMRHELEDFVDDYVLPHSLKPETDPSIVYYYYSLQTDWPSFPRYKKGYFSEPLNAYDEYISGEEGFEYSQMNTVYSIMYDSYLSGSNAAIFLAYENGHVESYSNNGAPHEKLIYTGFQGYINVVSDISNIVMLTGTFSNGSGHRDAFIFGDNLIEFSREYSNDIISGYYIYGMSKDPDPQIITSRSATYDHYIYSSDDLIAKVGIRCQSLDIGDVPYNYYYSGDNGYTFNQTAARNYVKNKADNYTGAKFSADNSFRISIKGVDHYYLPKEYSAAEDDPDTSEWEDNTDYDEDDDAPIYAPTVDPIVPEQKAIAIGGDVAPYKRNADVDMPIMIGDPVKLSSEPHLISVVYPCLSKEIDYFNHQNDSYIIGNYVGNDDVDPKLASSTTISKGPGKGGGGQRK